MSLGENIRNLRLQKNLSQVDLGKILDVSDRTIGVWERNEKMPNFKTLQKIGDYFNVSLDFLCDRNKDFNNVVDDDLISLQRAYLRLDKDLRKRMIETNKIAFKEAFDEDSNDDTI